MQSSLRLLLFSCVTLSLPLVAQEPAAVPAPVPDVEPFSQEIADPFNDGVQGASGNRSAVMAARAIQGVRILGIAKSSTGEAEVLLGLSDKTTIHVRAGEQFTVSGAGPAAICELKSVGDQEIAIIVNGESEVRIR